MAICYNYQYIGPDECMGDSLTKINNNNYNAQTAICNLETILASVSGNLLSTINTLSSNMNQILNVPYAEYAWAANTNDDDIQLTVDSSNTLTLDTEVLTTKSIGSSLNVGTSQITLLAGTYDFKANSTLYNGFNQQVNAILSLYNYTDSATVASSYLHGDMNQYENINTLEGRMVLATSKVFEFRVLASNGSSSSGKSLFNGSKGKYGGGNAYSTNIGKDFRNRIRFWKIA